MKSRWTQGDSRPSERRVNGAGGITAPSTGAFVVLAILLSTGCSNTLAPEQDTLSAARARWASVSINPYVFVQQRSCFCGPSTLRPIQVEVVGGIVNSAVYRDTGEPVTQPLSTISTIDDLFDEVQDAIDRGAFSLNATYDAQYGFPTDVSIDYDQMIEDEEMAFRVTELQFLLMSGG